MSRIIGSWIFAVTSLIVVVHQAVSQNCVNVTTFNSALTPHIAGYSSRKSRIPDALVDENADVLCLQEYWLEEDMQEMLDAVESVYPHHYSAIHYQIGTVRKPLAWWQIDYPDSVCSVRDAFYFTTVLLPCLVREGCTDAFGKSSTEGLACLSDKCGSIMRGDYIHPDCISCAVLTASSFTTALGSCANPNPLGDHNRLNSPGLVLLSKKKINSASYSSFHPGAKMAIQRGYIEADIQDVGKVVCTHLTSVFSIYYEYDLNFGNFEAQQLHDIRTIQATFGNSEHILLGDMNTGPDIVDADPEKDNRGEVEANYNTLMGFGYQHHYVNQDGRCTYCSNNPLISDYPNILIDDVLLMGGTFSSVQSQRTLDATGNDPLSDHYGVRSQLCKSTK